MKKPKIYPEVLVSTDFLQRSDIIQQTKQINSEIYNVTFDHDVLGTVTEIFTMLPNGMMRLHAVYPNDCQGAEEFETAKDYYNNFLLSGEQTYLEYYHPEIGYFLQSRNVTTLDDQELL